MQGFKDKLFTPEGFYDSAGRKYETLKDTIWGSNQEL